MMLTNLLSHLKTFDSAMFRNILGVSEETFYDLVNVFSNLEKQYIETWNKKANRRRKWGSGKDAALRTSEDKVAFILLYVKMYPTQRFFAVITGLKQPTVNKWIHRLLPQLEAALGVKSALPERSKLRRMEELSKYCPELIFCLDATERPINRPSSSAKQKEYYSGKKKMHTVKRSVVISQKSHRIVLLGKPSSGRVHDIKLYRNDEFAFPRGSYLYADSGYAGLQDDDDLIRSFTPRKKSKHKPLTFIDKSYNRLLSGQRIGVENAIGGMKRSKIAGLKWRGRKENFEDQSNLVAAGIYNLNLKF